VCSSSFIGFSAVLQGNIRRLASLGAQLSASGQLTGRLTLTLTGGEMTDLAHLIQDLHDPDLEHRYDACKSLQHQAQLPRAALLALQQACQDPEPLISVTAYRALQRHDPGLLDPYPQDEPYRDLQRPYTTQEIILSLVLSAVILLLAFPLISILADDRFHRLWFISLPALLLAGFLAYLSFQQSKQRHLVAVLSSIIVGLLSAILAFLLLTGLFLLAVVAYRGY
jgi:hypothetical protein